MVAVPGALPVMMPLVGTDGPAVSGASLLHVPPVGVLFSVVVLPTHTIGAPVIIVGSALTVMTAVRGQLADEV